MRLHLTTAQHDEVRRYLSAPVERVAFLFTKPNRTTGTVQVDTARLLADRDYARQDHEGAVLADHVRPEIIATAHRAGLAVAKVHAHAWPGPTRFSRTDLRGLRELGPHMTWRLPGRPYIALVLGPDSFDGLVWHDRDRVTELDALVIDHTRLYPTNMSVARLHNPNEGGFADEG